MGEVIIKVKTSMNGSTVKTKTGYTVSEWELLPEYEKNEIVTEIVWGLIDVWEEIEE